jgi:hypothetical protein
MSNDFTVIVDEDRKYTLKKYLSMEQVIEKGPCAEALIYFIKFFPTKILLMEIDPDDKCNYNTNAFKKLMKALTKDDKWWDVISFLEEWGFIEMKDTTDVEWNNWWRNKRRRLARAKLKGKKKKK